MSKSTTPHRELIQGSLSLLGYHHPRGKLRFEVLSEGISGAVIYRIDSSHELLVLKVVLPESASFVVERGAREILFYSILSPTIPLSTPEVLGYHGPWHRGSALLLRAYNSPPPIKTWGKNRFHLSARELARLHSVYWDKTKTLEQYEWLCRPSGELGTYKDAALSSWRAL